MPSSRDLPNPVIELRSPGLHGDSLSTEPSGKPKNTGGGSLSLLQGDLPDPGIELGSAALQVDSLPAEQGSPLWIISNEITQAIDGENNKPLLSYLKRPT